VINLLINYDMQTGAPEDDNEYFDVFVLSDKICRNCRLFEGKS